MAKPWLRSKGKIVQIGRFFSFVDQEKRFLVTFLRKLVAFFVPEVCICPEKAVTLQPQSFVKH